MGKAGRLSFLRSGFGAHTAARQSDISCPASVLETKLRFGYSRFMHFPPIIRKCNEQTCNTHSYKRPDHTRLGELSRVRVLQCDTVDIGMSMNKIASF